MREGRGDEMREGAVVLCCVACSCSRSFSLLLLLLLLLLLVICVGVRRQWRAATSSHLLVLLSINLPLTPLPALPSFSPMHALDYCRLHVPSLLASTRLHMPCRCLCLPTTTFDLITSTPTPTPTSRHCLCLCLCDGAYAPMCWCLWHGLVII